MATTHITSKKARPPRNRTHLTAQPLPTTRYVVRDKDWEKVWGVNLGHAAAQKLKELVAGRHLSRTVRVEPMPAEHEKQLLELCKPENVQSLATAAVPKKKTNGHRPAPAPSVAQVDLGSLDNGETDLDEDEDSELGEDDDAAVDDLLTP